MFARWRVTMTDPVEKRREMLEELADRDDLRVGEYAQALLDDANGADGD